jgi:hypothetical protein
MTNIVTGCANVDDSVEMIIFKGKGGKSWEKL